MAPSKSCGIESSDTVVGRARIGNTEPTIANGALNA